MDITDDYMIAFLVAAACSCAAVINIIMLDRLMTNQSEKKQRSTTSSISANAMPKASIETINQASPASTAHIDTIIPDRHIETQSKLEVPLRKGEVDAL